MTDEYFSFTIDGTLPGLNEYIQAERGNRYAAATLKRKTQDRIVAAIREQLGDIHIRQPVSMRYVWVERDRRRDKDNIAFARKFVQDALVEAGVLINDGWKNIVRFSDEFGIDAGDPHVYVIIHALRGLL